MKMRTYGDLINALTTLVNSNPEILQMNLAFKLDDEYFSGSTHPVILSLSTDDVLDKNHPYFELCVL